MDIYDYTIPYRKTVTNSQPNQNDVCMMTLLSQLLTCNIEDNTYVCFLVTCQQANETAETQYWRHICGVSWATQDTNHIYYISNAVWSWIQVRIDGSMGPGAPLPTPTFKHFFLNFAYLWTFAPRWGWNELNLWLRVISFQKSPSRR